MAKAPKLSANQIQAARLALSHAEADAQCGGEWDEERSAELELGCKVLTKLLNDAIDNSEGKR
jgi:hypothetical protein